MDFDVHNHEVALADSSNRAFGEIEHIPEGAYGLSDLWVGNQLLPLLDVLCRVHMPVPLPQPDDA